MLQEDSCVSYTGEGVSLYRWIQTKLKLVESIGSLQVKQTTGLPCEIVFLCFYR